MTRSTARIALLAYVVGGWLIPAVHHHGDHAPSSHRAEGGGHHQCEHHHGSDGRCHTAELSQTPVSAGDGDFAIAAGSSQSCSGLCAICASRTLTKSKPPAVALFAAADPLATRYSPGELSGPLSQAPGLPLSRGPPVA